MKIILLKEQQVHLVVDLFNAYRMFYGKSEDKEGAERFIRERIKNNESVIFLAINESESEGMGFVQLYPSFTSIGIKKIIILNDLYVDPRYRRVGIARSLMETVNHYAKNLGLEKITLQTAKSNLQAQSLYKSLGYIEEEHFLTYNLKL